MSKLTTALDGSAVENNTLRDCLAKTDGTLMEICQLLDLDPTGDVVVELKARKTPAAPKPPPEPWGAWMSIGRGGLMRTRRAGVEMQIVSNDALGSARPWEWRWWTNSSMGEALGIGFAFPEEARLACEGYTADKEGVPTTKAPTRDPELDDAVMQGIDAGLATARDPLILVDHTNRRALYIGSTPEAAWLRYRSDLRSVDAHRQITPEMVAALDPASPLRRWLDAVPCAPRLSSFSRELGAPPEGYTLHTIVDPDEVWPLYPTP